ncbi:hypothetical protein GCM10010168_82370 [Actinoplanes ianthinogenes]|nr:hypothetical protein GCM10010168_82370 [Actinoplanes ianthinogenes]
MPLQGAPIGDPNRNLKVSAGSRPPDTDLDRPNVRKAAAGVDAYPFRYRSWWT